MLFGRIIMFGLHTRAMKAKLTLFTLIASAALVAFAPSFSFVLLGAAGALRGRSAAAGVAVGAAVLTRTIAAFALIPLAVLPLAQRSVGRSAATITACVEPYIFGVVWWLARPGSALNWRVLVPVLLTADVLLSKVSESLSTDWLIAEGIMSSVLIAAVVAMVFADLWRSPQHGVASGNNG